MAELLEHEPDAAMEAEVAGETEALDRAVEAFPEAADIFERNIETMEKLGHEGWDKLGLQVK